EAKWIGPETSDLFGLADGGTAAVLAIGHPGLQLIAPPVFRLRSPARGTLPLGFARKPVGLSRRFQSQVTNCLASLQLTFVTGASSFPVASKPHALAAKHAFHSWTVTGNLLMEKGLMAT